VYTLVVLSRLASRILGKDRHGKDTYGVLEDIIQAALVSAKTAKQKRRKTQQEEQVVEDWADNLDNENF
jgi:hypothetical protein